MGVAGGVGRDDELREVGVASERVGDHAEDEFDVGELPGFFDEDGVGAESVTAMDEVDFAGEVGEVEDVIESGVAAADHGDVLALVEGAVAGGAEGKAVAEVLGFVGEAERLVARTGGEDEGVGRVGGVGGLDVETGFKRLEAGDRVENKFGAERAGLSINVLGQGFAGDLLGAGPVVDFGDLDDLAAGDFGFQNQGRFAGAKGVDGGGEAGDAGADDDDVVSVTLH